MYALAKFQPDAPLSFRVMTQQSSNSKMIDLYRGTGAYEKMSHRVATCNIVYAMNRDIHYWVRVSLYYSSSRHTEMKSLKTNQLVRSFQHDINKES